jgi:cytochrome c biogenesis protein CcmG/thiol:disulfide interchange protein DsbE
MNIRLITWQAFVLIVTAGVAFADETLPVLKVGSEVYSNVTVTSVSATDIYFSFKGGMGNAKLKSLSPELQTHFRFNPTNAAQAEIKQRQANAQFRAELANKKPAANSRPAAETAAVATTDESGDPIVPKLYAKSVRGQRPPQIFVEQWLTPPPDVTGKFVLVDFWATWCGPCRAAIPHLNELQAKFRDRLVVIGLSDESPEDMKKMSSPKVNYWIGTDTQGRTMKALEVAGIPHAILIDPNGIVRFEGMPTYLDEAALTRLLEKYGK